MIRATMETPEDPKTRLLERFGHLRLARVMRPCNAVGDSHSLLMAALWDHQTGVTLSLVRQVNNALDHDKRTVGEFLADAERAGHTVLQHAVISGRIDHYLNTELRKRVTL